MIILMGIKHCGKSTVGKVLADKLGIPFFDIDDEIGRMCGISVRELYASQGKDAFMRAEADACRAVLERVRGESVALSADSVSHQVVTADKAGGAVIATGGGICDNEIAVAELTAAGCRLVYLCVDEKTACDRILVESEKTGSLPVYIQKEHPVCEQDVRAIFHEFYCRRTKAYEALCGTTVNVSGKTPEAIAAEICALPE